jgi:rare lipoprotein A
LIRAKLIVPIAGAIVVLCCTVLGGGAAVASSRAVEAAPPATQLPVILSSRVLRENVLLGRSVSVIGSLEPNTDTEVVTLQGRHGHAWTVLAATHSVATGVFTLRFRPSHVGAMTMRVQASGALGVIQTTSAKVDVYHRVLASWYGPGGRTACGEELTAKTLGVANKTLPCGTRVTLHYHHRTLRVRVIDRGPYVAGRDYDLTYATKRALGAGDLTELWATR